MNKKGLKEILSPMSFSEKLDYLWTYYKWVLAAAAGVVMLICIVVTCVKNIRTETLYCGMLINVEVSEEGNQFLTSQWFDALEGDPRGEKVELMTTYFQPHSVTSSMDMVAGSVIQVTAPVAAQEIDYILMDEVGFAYYQNYSIFAPLTDMISAGQLEQMSEYLKYSEEGHPVAIDISDSTFAADCITGEENVYLAFCGNTGRTAQNPQFLDYLLQWG